jgi:cytochrome c1
MKGLKLLAIPALSLLLSGCRDMWDTGAYQVRMDGDPRHGKELIQDYSCGACHMIPGIYTARGLVGPPLIYFGRRAVIAGHLPNSPVNLIQWIQNPQDVDPGTAMPNLRIGLEQAQDIASYLYTLR